MTTWQKFDPRNWRPSIQFGAFAIFLVLWFWYALGGTELFYWTRFFIFQARDLARASALLHGHPIFFGPEMTGGGYLPGPAYYLSLAAALLISPTWVSAWWLLILFLGLAALAGFAFFARQKAIGEAILWIGVFAMSAKTFITAQFFLNISYVWPFATAAAVLIATAYSSEDPRTQRRALGGAALAAALALQFHFSTIVFPISVILLQVFAKPLRLRPVGRNGVITALILFCIPLLPFFVWWTSKALGYPLGQEIHYAGAAGGAPRSLALLMEEMLALGPYELFRSTIFRFATSVPPFCALVIIAYFMTERRAPRAQVFALAVCTFVGFFPLAYWFFAAIGVRYGTPFTITLYLLSILLFREVRRTPRALRFYVAGSAVAFTLGWAYVFLYEQLAVDKTMILVNLGLMILPTMVIFFADDEFRAGKWLTAAAVALTFGTTSVHRLVSVTSDFTIVPRQMPRLTDWVKLLRPIYLRTGWTSEEGLQRLYFVSHHLEQDPKFIYDWIEANTDRSGLPPAPKIDGYFICYEYDGKSMEPEDIKDWLLKQYIQSDVREALQRGDLIVRRSANPTMLVAPFTVVNPAALSRHFHNVSEGYVASAEDRMIAALPGPAAAKKLGADRYLFKWNECPDQHSFCSAGTIVEMQHTGADYIAKVRIAGQVLSQISPWVSPSWTQRWIEPYLEVRCGEQLLHFPLISSIGYAREYAATPDYRFLYGNNSLIAPFERELQFKCADLKEVAVGRKGSEVESLYKLDALPPQRLALTPQ